MTTVFTSDAAVARIGLGLLDRSLPKTEWTHAGHFAATLWLLDRDGAAATFAALPGLIRAYNAATGGENTETAGYHATITIASLRGACHAHEAWRAAGCEGSLVSVVNALLAGVLGDPNWLLAYWSRDALFTPRARLHWLAPDLAQLPYPEPPGWR